MVEKNTSLSVCCNFHSGFLSLIGKISNHTVFIRANINHEQFSFPNWNIFVKSAYQKYILRFPQITVLIKFIRNVSLIFTLIQRIDITKFSFWTVFFTLEDRKYNMIYNREHNVIMADNTNLGWLLSGNNIK